MSERNEDEGLTESEVEEFKGVMRQEIMRRAARNIPGLFAKPEERGKGS